MKKMSTLLTMRLTSLESISDFFQTRYYQMKNSVHEWLWKRGLTETTPPMELDLTSMLDAAERQNTLRKILK